MWPQGRFGRLREISPPTGTRSPDCPARSQSLYRLSYPGTHILNSRDLSLYEILCAGCAAELVRRAVTCLNKTEQVYVRWQDFRFDLVLVKWPAAISTAWRDLRLRGHEIGLLEEPLCHQTEDSGFDNPDGPAENVKRPLPGVFSACD